MATDVPMGGMGNAGGASPVASGGSTTSMGGQIDAGGFAGEPQVPGGGSTSMPNGGTGGADEDPVDQPDLTCTLQGAATANTPTVYVVGDSTASNYASDLYPRTGWGQVLQQSFTTACVTVDNRALSGRSSKSFFDEGAWTPIEAALGAGDFVLIQFGHNDEKTEDAARGTDPDTTFKQYLSIYIDDSLAKGATPILLTPINRNNWNSTTLKDSHGEYPRAMRELAAARNVSLVDATALTKTHFERIGPAATNEYFMNLAPGQFPNYPEGNEDNTHLREGGATVIAQIVLADLYAQGVEPGTLAKSVPVAP
jgi:lysophospholipase L1-like esterase